jgi:tetratricopeptide (TPR) repeat protein
MRSIRICLPLFLAALAPATMQAAVQASEGTITIPTYLLGPADPNPAFPLLHASPVYPYSMLDDLTNRRAPKTYRALFLENKYLKLTLLPQLGGHLYSIYDKVDHREELYRNHVVKYGLIGPRGAWISGGIEFSFPFAHTDVTVSPVESSLKHNPDGSATATVGAIDWVSNMHWEIAITLRPNTARVEQKVTLFNATPLPHLYLFWANAAVKASDDMQYIYPMRETISDDPFAVVQSWPVWKGVDRSWYKNDPHALAIFARDSHRNFFGIYYHQANYGVVHVANFRKDPGKKVWTWGTAPSGMIWAHILSDNDGPYCEIQSGRFPTQGYRELMPAGRVETWTEYWYPVRGLDGGFVDANNKLALNAVYQQGAVKLIVSPVAEVSGATMEVNIGTKRLRAFPQLHFSPLQPSTFTIPVRNLDAARKDLGVEIRSSQGRVILHWSAAQPLDGNPDFAPKAGTRLRQRISYTSKTPSEEAYLHGLFLEKQGKLQPALKVYREILARDPGYIPALRKEAQYAYLAANLQKAESFISRALARNDEDPATQYLAGVIDRAAGRLTLAEDAFWKSIHYGGRPAPAFAELGEIAIRQKEYAKAAALLRRALSYNRGDALALADLAVAERLAGHIAAAQNASAQALRKMPLLPYALAEQWQDAGASSKDWARIVGIDPQNYVAIAAWYRDLGDSSSSDAVLHLAMQNLPAKEIPAMAYYDLSAKAQSCDSFFPNRVSDALMLKQAIARNPGDACAQYALGNFLFAHARYKEAASLWSKALNAPSRDNAAAAPAPVLLRNLGVYAWRVKKDLPSAASFFARAIRLQPSDFRLYTDLDEIYAQTENASARAKLFANAPAEVSNHDTVRARYVLFLIEQSKFDKALSELSAHEFKPWEGAVGIHNLFVAANMGKGYAALRRHSPDEAAQDFRQAMQYPKNLGVGKPDMPEQSQQLYGLGLALAAEGKPAEAQTAWKRAAQNAKDANGIPAIYSALALKRVGKSAQAQQILEHCIEEARQPNVHASTYFVAGLAEHHLGNAENARRDFQRALQLDPSFWQARVALSGSELF